MSMPISSWKNPVHILAFGLGSGAAPKAPGTFGTLAAVGIYYFWLQQLTLLPFLVLIVVSFFIGVWLCDKTSRDLGVHDHSGIVFDEWVGFWITMIAVPAGWQWLLLGFLLFRLFDIWKPQPIRWLDKHVQGGFGIMIDDVLAGIYALVVLQLCIVFLT